MAGRFPLYTDADIHGPLIEGLIDRGWDVVRAVKTRPEGEDDLVHFQLAAELNRVLVAYDRHQRKIALDWIGAGDGLNEVVAATREGRLYLWDTEAATRADGIPWQGSGRDRRNTKNLSSGVSPLGRR